MIGFLLTGAKYLGIRFLMNKVTNLLTPNTGNISILIILLILILGIVIYINKDSCASLVTNHRKLDLYAPESVVVHNQQGQTKVSETLQLLSEATLVINILESIEDVHPLTLDMSDKKPIDAFHYARNVYFLRQNEIIRRIQAVTNESSYHYLYLAEQKRKRNLRREYELNESMMTKVMADLMHDYHRSGQKNEMFEKLSQKFRRHNRQLIRSVPAICN
jgi:hypothetical protein